MIKTYKTKKPWWQSRTVWSGIFKIIAGMCLSVVSWLNSEIDSQAVTAGLIGSLWGIWDIIIRFGTNKSII